MIAAEFQRHAERVFPLVSHMGLTVKTLTPEECQLEGEWAKNSNHVQTVFGGSLYCFSALSCYGLFWAMLTSRGQMTQNIVISEGRIEYEAPVTGDFVARCRAPSEKERERFFSALEKKGKARLDLQADILFNDQIGAVFYGTYVAKKEIG